MTNQVFGWAIDQMHKGERVQRAGWNGKGMFLFLVRKWEMSSPFPGNTVSWHLIRDNEFAPFIAMKTVDGKIVPWLASQTDMLASDWSVVE